MFEEAKKLGINLYNLVDGSISGVLSVTNAGLEYVNDELEDAIDNLLSRDKLDDEDKRLANKAKTKSSQSSLLVLLTEDLKDTLNSTDKQTADKTKALMMDKVIDALTNYKDSPIGFISPSSSSSKGFELNILVDSKETVEVLKNTLRGLVEDDTKTIIEPDNISIGYFDSSNIADTGESFSLLFDSVVVVGLENVADELDRKLAQFLKDWKYRKIVTSLN